LPQALQESNATYECFVPVSCIPHSSSCAGISTSPRMIASSDAHDCVGERGTSSLREDAHCGRGKAGDSYALIELNFAERGVQIGSSQHRRLSMSNDVPIQGGKEGGGGRGADQGATCHPRQQSTACPPTTRCRSAPCNPGRGPRGRSRSACRTCVSRTPRLSAVGRPGRGRGWVGRPGGRRWQGWGCPGRSPGRTAPVAGERRPHRPQRWTAGRGGGGSTLEEPARRQM